MLVGQFQGLKESRDRPRLITAIEADAILRASASKTHTPLPGNGFLMKWFRTTSYNDGVVTIVINQSNCVDNSTSALVNVRTALPTNGQPSPSITRQVQPETFIPV